MKILYQYNLEECAEAFIPVLHGMADQLRTHPPEFWTEVELKRHASWCEAMARSMAGALKLES